MAAVPAAPLGWGRSECVFREWWQKNGRVLPFSESESECVLHAFTPNASGNVNYIVWCRNLVQEEEQLMEEKKRKKDDKKKKEAAQKKVVCV